MSRNVRQIYRRLYDFSDKRRISRAYAIPDSNILFLYRTERLIHGKLQGTAQRIYHVTIDLDSQEIVHSCPDWGGEPTMLCKHILKILIKTPPDLLNVVLDRLGGFETASDEESIQFYEKEVVLQVVEDELEKGQEEGEDKAQQAERIILAFVTALENKTFQVNDLPETFWSSLRTLASENALRAVILWGEKILPFVRDLSEIDSNAVYFLTKKAILSLTSKNLPMLIFCSYLHQLQQTTMILHGTLLFNDFVAELIQLLPSQNRPQLVLLRAWLERMANPASPRVQENDSVRDILFNAYQVGTLLLKEETRVKSVESLLRFFEAWDARCESLKKQYQEENKHRQQIFRMKRLSFFNWLLDKEASRQNEEPHLWITRTTQDLAYVSYQDSSHPELLRYIMNRLGATNMEDYVPVDILARAHPLTSRIINMSMLQRTKYPSLVKKYWGSMQKPVRVPRYKEPRLQQPTEDLRRFTKNPRQWFILQWDISPSHVTHSLLWSTWGRLRLYPDPRSPLTSKIAPYMLTIARYPFYSISWHEALAFPVRIISPTEALQLIEYGISASGPLWDLLTLTWIVRGWKPLERVNKIIQDATDRYPFIPTNNDFVKAVTDAMTSWTVLRFCHQVLQVKNREKTLSTEEMTAILNAINPKVASEFLSCWNHRVVKSDELLRMLWFNALDKSHSIASFYATLLVQMARAINTTPIFLLDLKRMIYSRFVLNETPPQSLNTEKG